MTRNGREDPGSAPVRALVSAVALGAAETVKWLCQLDHLAPRFGWSVIAEIAVLRGSITAEWGWRPKTQENNAAWVYQIRIAGTLLDLLLVLTAGFEAHPASVHSPISRWRPLSP